MAHNVLHTSTALLIAYTLWLGLRIKLGLEMVQALQLQDDSTTMIRSNVSKLLYKGPKCPSVMKQWYNFKQVWNVQ